MGKMQGTGMLLALALTACSPTPPPAPPAEAPAPAPAPPAPTVIAEARIDRWDEAAMAAIVPADYKIEKLAEGFQWAEGPVWIASGNYLLFTDVPGNKMWKWSEASGLEIFLDPSGAASVDENVWREAGANGLAVDTDGTILMADTGNRAAEVLDQDGGERGVRPRKPVDHRFKRFIRQRAQEMRAPVDLQSRRESLVEHRLQCGVGHRRNLIGQWRPEFAKWPQHPLALLDRPVVRGDQPNDRHAVRRGHQPGEDRYLIGC